MTSVSHLSCTVWSAECAAMATHEETQILIFFRAMQLHIWCLINYTLMAGFALLHRQF